MTPNMTAFLLMLRTAEGTAGPDGYRMLFGGKLFNGFDDHPRIAVTRMSNGKPITSTAAGAYQILAHSWDEGADELNLPDFTPESQDAWAVWKIGKRGATDLIEAGSFSAAVDKCRHEWASLPGAGYGQPEQRLDRLQAAYEDAGGTVA